MTNAVPDDQSPSSPASRWPGANYGNRTLGVFLFIYFLLGTTLPFELLLHSC